MITAIDSSVLLDIFQREPEWGIPSREMLKKCLQDGCVVACEIVWTEVGAAFPESRLFVHAMKTLPIEFSSISLETTILAGNMWSQYRARGGKRDRVVPDFLIAAHAITQCDRLLSRDRGFYRDYFDGLTLLEPAKP